jgi:hypothetical protein
MRPWSRQRTLGLGVAIIVVTNAIALAGVWWNRQPPADGNPTLSERELGLPWRGPRLRENSGLALDLRWRVIDREGAEVGSSFPFNGGTPQWLDAGRMAALGFAPGEVASDAGRRRYLKQLPHEAVLVLELAGPSWEYAVARARADAGRHAAAAAANPGSKEFAGRAKRAQEALTREEFTNSRLFVVDAGLDPEALRRQYPDRNRFLLLRGTVRPAVRDGDNGQPVAAGRIGNFRGIRVQVPHAQRATLEPFEAGPTGQPVAGSRYEVMLAVGRKLEPWIVSVRPLSKGH